MNAVLNNDFTSCMNAVLSKEPYMWVCFNRLNVYKFLRASVKESRDLKTLGYFFVTDLLLNFCLIKHLPSPPLSFSLSLSLSLSSVKESRDLKTLGYFFATDLLQSFVLNQNVKVAVSSLVDKLQLLLN
jgi:hypothetical protein